jgi:hypothetical protein
VPADPTLLDAILAPGGLTVVFQPVFEAVVDRACVATALADAGLLPGQPRLSLNVHASTLGRDPGFPGFLLRTAQQADIEPRRLIVEIVEHAPALDVPGFRRALAALRETGIAIALDDVGLGQSNYKMILDARPEIYKLDKYLVSGAWSDPWPAWSGASRPGPWPRASRATTSSWPSRPPASTSSRASCWPDPSRARRF